MIVLFFMTLLYVLPTKKATTVYVAATEKPIIEAHALTYVVPRASVRWLKRDPEVFESVLPIESIHTFALN